MTGPEDENIRLRRFVRLDPPDQLVGLRLVDNPHLDIDPSAAALADLRPERHVEIVAGSAVADHLPATLDHHVLQRPAADRANELGRPYQHERALSPRRR